MARFRRMKAQTVTEFDPAKAYRFEGSRDGCGIVRGELEVYEVGAIPKRYFKDVGNGFKNLHGHDERLARDHRLRSAAHGLLYGLSNFIDG